MSYTSLYVIDHEFMLHGHDEFSNGMIMPLFWQELYEKHCPEKLSYDPIFMPILIRDNEWDEWEKKWTKINNRIMKSNNIHDKIMWKLTF